MLKGAGSEAMIVRGTKGPSALSNGEWRYRADTA